MVRDVVESSSGERENTPWMPDEHSRFLEGLRLYGKNWKKVTEHVGTRTRPLIASHAQQFKNKVRKFPGIEGADLLEVLE